MSLDETTSASAARTRTIGIRVSADFEELAMLRAVAETIALLADFGIDEVTDIRLALEEVATTLIRDAVPGSELDCEIGYDDTSMTIRVASIAASDLGPDQNGMSWHIVSTLTDSVSTTVEPIDAATGGYRTTIEFRWTSGVR